MMAGKKIQVTERISLEFRAEAVKLTNTPALRNPNGSFGTPAFGTITGAFDSRVYELVEKVHF